MNKVKLTQKQAEAIEDYLSPESFNMSKDELLIEHATDGGMYWLNKLEVDLPLLAKALYIGYEMKQEFEVGDWVKSKLGKGIGKIIKIDNLGYLTDFGLAVPKEDDIIRYATDEEISKEKQRRLDEKLDKILLELTDYERERLTVKLSGGND